MDIKQFVFSRAMEAKEGAKSLARASSKQKNQVLIKMAKAVKNRAEELISENKKDIEYAEKKGLSKALIDRLALTKNASMKWLKDSGK